MSSNEAAVRRGLSVSVTASVLLVTVSGDDDSVVSFMYIRT